MGKLMSPQRTLVWQRSRPNDDTQVPGGQCTRQDPRSRSFRGQTANATDLRNGPFDDVKVAHRTVVPSRRFQDQERCRENCYHWVHCSRCAPKNRFGVRLRMILIWEYLIPFSTAGVMRCFIVHFPPIRTVGQLARARNPDYGCREFAFLFSVDAKQMLPFGHIGAGHDKLTMLAAGRSLEGNPSLSASCGEPYCCWVRYAAGSRHRQRLRPTRICSRLTLGRIVSNCCKSTEIPAPAWTNWCAEDDG